jgi:Xaa-Pro dipeptidase
MPNDIKKPFKVPDDEINSRIVALQNELQLNGIDGVLIIQRADLFYFSGTAQNGCLYVPVEHKPLLFIKQNYQRALAESSIAAIFEIRSIKDIPHLIHDHIGRSPTIMGFELDVMPVNEFNFYRSLFNPNKAIDASPSILKFRKINWGW